MAFSEYGSSYGMNGPASFRYLAADLFKGASLNISHPTEGFKIIPPNWITINDATCYSYRSGTNVGLNDRRKPTAFPTGTFSASDIIWNLGVGYPSFMWGTYDVTFTPGLRWSFFGNGNATRTAYNEAAGTATIVISASTDNIIAITWQGYDNGGGYVARTLPSSADMYFTIRPQGISPSAIYRTDTPSTSDLAPFAGGVLRNMGLFVTNRAAITGFTWGVVGSVDIPLLDDMTWVSSMGPPPELQFAFARAVGMTAKFNIFDRLTDAGKTAYAQRIKDYRLTGEKVHVENGNEYWNFGGSFMQSTSINERAQVSLAYNSGGTYQVLVGDTVTGATSGATGIVTYVKLNSGTWAAGTATGYIEIDPDTDTGTFSPAENLNVGANSNVATLTAVGVLNHIQYARETGRLFDTFNTVFGASSGDLVFWVCWQFVAAWSVFAAILNEEGLFTKVATSNGVVAGAPYGGNFGDYSDTAAIPKVTRDLVLTDVAAYKAAYFAKLTTALDTGKTNFFAFVTNLRDYCANKGLARAAIRHGTYEHAPQHIIESNTPTTSNLRDLTRQAMAEMNRDARMGVLAVEQLKFLTDTSGVFIHFAYDYPVTAAGMVNGLWGSLDYPGEVTDEPYASLAGYLSNPQPRLRSGLRIGMTV